MSLYLLTILNLLCSVRQSSSFTVFDCDAGYATSKTIDLREPSSCRDPVKDYREPDVQRVQIVQIGTTSPIIGYQCKATISKEVWRCGLDSLHYGSSRPVFQQNWPIAPNQCREAVASGRIIIDHRSYDILPGQPITLQEYTHGHRHVDGRCETADFETAGIMHYRSYEQTTTTIHVSAVNGIIDAADDSIVFSNGIAAQANDLVLHDLYEGTIVWKRPELNCSDSVSSLYVGNVTLHQPTGHTNSKVGSVVLLERPSDQQYAGLKLGLPRSLCAVHCYGTSIKGIVVCLLRPHDEPQLLDTFKITDSQREIDFQSQLGFLHLKTNLDVYARFAAILGHICKIERATLHLKLQAIAGANNPYSLLDLYGPGHVYYRAGAVVYINKCTPVEATLADHANCTTEVPVLVNGTKRFADPLSWVLRDYPQELPCSNIMPVRWKLGDIWYCATPAAFKCEAPEQLQVSEPLFTMPDIGAGLEGGIYTDTQRQQHQQFIRSSSGREAVVSKIATAAVRNAGAHGVLGLPLTELDLHTLIGELGYSFVPFFGLIGHAYVTMVGIFVVLAFAKTLVSCLLRGYMLVNQRGWGIYLFAAGWDTLFHVFHMPHAALWNALQMAANKPEEDPPVELEPLNPANPPNAPPPPPPQPPQLYPRHDE